MGQGYVSGVGINNSGGSNAFGLSLGQEPNHFGNGATSRSDVIDLVNAQGESDQAWLDSYDTNTKTYIVIDYQDNDIQKNRFTEALVRHYGEWASVAIPTTVDLSHESITELKDVSDFVSKIGYALVASSSTATNWGGVPVFLKPQADADTLSVAELLTIVSAPTAAATFTESDYSTFVTTDAGEVLKVDLKAIQSEIESVESSIATNATNIQANTDELARRLALTADDDHWNANSKRIGNLTSGSHAQDAVTKQQLDAAVGKFSDFPTYKSFSDFETALTARGGSLTFKDLGDEGLSDDEIRGYNMSELFSKMLDREQIFWDAAQDYDNIFPVSYTKAFIERLSSTRCSATLSTKNNSDFYDFSQESTSASGVWKQRAQFNTDSNLHLGSRKISYDEKTDATTTGASFLEFDVGDLSAQVNNEFKVQVNNGDEFKIDFGNVNLGSRDLLNPTSIKIDNTTQSLIYSAHHNNQFINFSSDGALSIGVEDSKPINFDFAGSTVQSLTSAAINFNNTQAINVSNAVNLTDAPNYGQMQAYVDDEFEKAESPSDEGVMQLLDLTRTSQNGGYGKNKQITYKGIQSGDNTDLDTDLSLIWAIHVKTGSRVCFLHFHEDFLEQYINGGSVSGFDSLSISIENSKFALGKANQNAPTNGMWSYEGLAIPNVDPNSTTNTQFLDANGDNTDRAGALSATYSSSLSNNVDGILFQRGYVNTQTTSSTESTFSANSSSPWFISKALVGNGTFDVLKKFMVFQKSADDQEAIQVIYDGAANELGGKINNNTETINQLDERVTVLEDDEVALAADSNGVAESILVKNSLSGSFSMMDNSVKTFNLNILNQVVSFDLLLSIKSSSESQREFKVIHVYNNDGSFSVTEGVSYGYEFSQLSFSYDVVGSASNDGATISIVGTGDGAQLQFTYKTKFNFAN